MRVLFTSPSYFGPKGIFGGGERYAVELARAVAAQLGDGIGTLYAGASEDEEWREGALQVVLRRPWFLVRRQPLNPLPRDLTRLIRTADVVHCFQRQVVLSSIVALIARLLGKPAFVTALGGGGWDLSAYWDTRTWWTGHLHLSQFAAQVEGRSGHPADAVLYGGAHPSTDGPGDGEDILFVGRLVPHKGADVLLRAVDPDWRTTICGAPMDAAYVRELGRLAEGKRVAFVFSPADAVLEECYRRAAILVAPSLERDWRGNHTAVPELLGLAVIEAASRGIPVVASSVGSLPEVVQDGVTGFLVPPGDPESLRARIAELLADGELRRELGQAARIRAMADFSWASAAGRAVDAYARALQAARVR